MDRQADRLGGGKGCELRRRHRLLLRQHRLVASQCQRRLGNLRRAHAIHLQLELLEQVRLVHLHLLQPLLDFLVHYVHGLLAVGGGVGHGALPR